MKKKTIIKKIDNFLEKMFKVNRSLAGAENRKTLYEIKKIIPIKIKSIKSNKKIYDWKVPKEWSIKDGYIKDMKGVKIVDFKQNNLHVASYSQPVNKICNWAEIKKQLIYSKKLKKGIPYRTTYYSDNWMFCCNFKQYQEVKKNKKVKIRIDSKFINGKMNYGELLIKGKSKKEILISTYICHPSMANDNLSGIILTSILAQKLMKKKNLSFSYRIIFVPETIGAIGYTYLNQKRLQNSYCGFVISCVGGPGKFFLKKSWNKDHFINQLALDVTKTLKKKIIVKNFDINGSDERQFSSVGIRLNTITISKDKYYEYKEYHNSKDDLNFVKAKNINKSLLIYEDLIEKIEKQKNI